MTVPHPVPLETTAGKRGNASAQIKKHVISFHGLQHKDNARLNVETIESSHGVTLHTVVDLACNFGASFETTRESRPRFRVVQRLFLLLLTGAKTIPLSPDFSRTLKLHVPVS